MGMRHARARFAHTVLLVVLPVFGVFASGSASAFQLPETRSLGEAAGPVWPRIPPGLRRPSAIHAGDVLTVRVAGEDDLSGVHCVSDSGLIDLPMAGPVAVAGVDVNEAAQRLSKALADGYLMQPEVAVTILHSEYRTVFVVGLVQWGGVVTTDQALTLDRVMTLAGGPAPGAGRTASVVRPDVQRAVTPTSIEDATARVFTFDLDREGGEVLRDGDTVYVTGRQRSF